MIKFLLFFSILFSGNIFAQSNEEKGLSIVQKSIDLDKGFVDVSSEGVMILKDKSGNESERKFKSLTFEELDENLGNKGIIVFTTPRDIRGTALLTHDNIEPKDDDQWLYLPALKRVKRISSSNRTGKFVSSEFSYEDLSTDEPKDYIFTWIEDSVCPTNEALMCHVIEAKPKNKKSGYSKRIIFIDDQFFRYQKVSFFNRRGGLEKELSFIGYNQYLDKFWRADILEMINIQTGKSTSLQWSNYQFKQGLELSDFDPEKLKNASR